MFVFRKISACKRQREAIENAKKQSDKPSMIVLNTVKAHGWSKMENQIGSHCPTISSEQLADALSEMEAALASI